MTSNYVSPIDLNSSQFDCEAYLNNLLRRKGLDELVAVEESTVHSVRRLDSEMQQLVYENYSKFLTATCTVKRMQNDFMKLGDEMDALSISMKRISNLSRGLCDAFGKHRSNVLKLSEANKIIQRLQFILNLPQKLQELFEQRNYSECIKIYLAAQSSLNDKSLSSFRSIREESAQIMAKIEETLKSAVENSSFSSDELINAVELLFKLRVPPAPIYLLFLENCRQALCAQIHALSSRETKIFEEDTLEFVDEACSKFLADISLVSTLYQRLFADQLVSIKLVEMVRDRMAAFEEAVKSRFFLETDARECAIVVRALDRFYRRVSSCDKIILGVNCCSVAISMLNAVSRHEIILCRKQVLEQIGTCILQIRNDLANSRCSEQSSGTALSDIVSKLEQTLLVQLKTALASLLLFTASDMTFSSLEPASFLLGFGVDVHETLVVLVLEEINSLARSYYELDSNKSSVSPTLIIVLAQFFANFGNHSVQYILDLCQEQFRLVDETGVKGELKLTSFEKIHLLYKTTASGLLKRYVYLQSVLVSQLLVRSIESRDWLNCSEPTSVRSAVKHMFESLASLDSLIEPFMEEGVRKERPSSGVVTPRFHIRRNPNYDTYSTTSTLDKLWADRVDFSANIEFNRASVLSALINIVLKSFLEVIRLQTFSKFGLQQIQIDCYYLQQTLWQFISDEQSTMSLLDEIVSSAMHRCYDPKLLDLSLCKAIYDQQKFFN